MKLRTDDGLGM